MEDHIMTTREEKIKCLSWQRLLIYIVFVSILGYLNCLAAMSMNTDSLSGKISRNILETNHVNLAMEMDWIGKYQQELVRSAFRQRMLWYHGAYKMDHGSPCRPEDPYGRNPADNSLTKPLMPLIEAPEAEPEMILEDWMIVPGGWKTEMLHNL
jgi:hypothetical protein